MLGHKDVGKDYTKRIRLRSDDAMLQHKEDDAVGTASNPERTPEVLGHLTTHIGASREATVSCCASGSNLRYEW